MPLSTNPADCIMWVGDIGTIYLQKEQGQEWAVLALYFQTAHSPFRSGKAMIVLVDPENTTSRGAARFCITDNLRMAQFIASQISSRFPEFNCASNLLKNLHYFDSAHFVSQGDETSCRVAKAIDYARGVDVEMRWHLEDGGSIYLEHKCLLSQGAKTISPAGEIMICSRTIVGRPTSVVSLTQNKTWEFPSI